MKQVILLIILICFVMSLTATEKSVGKAFLFSAAIPGTGQYYAENNTKASVFWAAEIAIIFTYFRFRSELDMAINSYEQFAYTHAEVPKGSEDFYYQLIQDYKNSEIYNDSVLRYARNVYLIYYNDPEGYEEYLQNYLIPEDRLWDWETDKNWYEYRQLRRDKQNVEIYTKFTVAAAILNRIVSAIDAALGTRNYNRDLHQSGGSLSVTPDFERKGFEIGYEYKF